MRLADVGKHGDLQEFPRHAGKQRNPRPTWPTDSIEDERVTKSTVAQEWTSESDSHEMSHQADADQAAQLEEQQHY